MSSTYTEHRELLGRAKVPNLRLGLFTLTDYACPPVRIFSKAVIRAYKGMRRCQIDSPVILPSEVFPTQVIPEMVPMIFWSNDDQKPVVICEDRELHVRPVYRDDKRLHESLIGVEPEFHEGRWLSLYLVQMFLVGD